MQQVLSFGRQLLLRVSKAYDIAYENNPYRTAGGTMAIKAGFCDVFAQKLLDPDCEMDYKRVAKFTIFCVAYVGCFQHAVFNVFYPCLFPGSGWRVAVKKTMFDNFVHSPFVYLPTYYIYKSVVDKGTIVEGFQVYHSTGLSILRQCWGLWIPAQFIGFAFVPANFRILYNAGVGCAWEVLLSYNVPLKETPRGGVVKQNSVFS